MNEIEGLKNPIKKQLKINNEKIEVKVNDIGCWYTGNKISQIMALNIVKYKDKTFKVMTKFIKNDKFEIIESEAIKPIRNKEKTIKTAAKLVSEQLLKEKGFDVLTLSQKYKKIEKTIKDK
ncbi:MAG: hypothetical protein BTN85_0242 [Candidatus Methanohalarchaeum thermophilum]|uniref:Uncharacterized protein n=1 Tax=Methanohalarchaeum thermophilum TaxID=1903181 RepID=A0A1Q6DTV2_METT1|nr:MAG: hypothetical protein BTN85_0242 [Candidatus Methanohalarchaeum thermophilum]